MRTPATSSGARFFFKQTSLFIYYINSLSYTAVICNKLRFGEFNDGLIKLASDISRSIADQHHRALGFKSVQGGLSRAKAGVMRRLSMVALRCTARQLLRGLTIVGPSCIHQHNARESARRRAQHDAFGADRGAPCRNPTNSGG